MLETIGQGKDLVLLHGLCFHSEIFESFAQSLAKQYRVTLLDLPGFGYSQNHKISKDFNQDLHQDTDNVFKEIFNIETLTSLILEKVPFPSTWITWSFSGLLGLHAAHQNPDKIHSLVMMASSPKFTQENESQKTLEQKQSWSGIEFEKLEEFSQSMQTDYLKTMNHFLNLQCLGTNGTIETFGTSDSINSKDLIKKLKIPLQNPLPNKDAMILGINILKNTDFRTIYQKLSCPIQFILGKNDNIVPHPINLSENLIKLNPKAEVSIIENASHLPFISHEKEVISLLHSFLNKR